MYKERKDNFSFKNYFLILLLILLFVFLILFLFPTKWELENKYNIEESNIVYKENFSYNVDKMKDAAIGYFTTERLPQTVGEVKRLTLQEMYNLNLILKLKDNNGNECNSTESYVEMTKDVSEYKLKVNLTCSAETAYVVVYLGVYNYCTNTSCENILPATVIEETKTYIYR